MLIHFNSLKQFFHSNITGILHIGAHECEEMNIYIENGVNMDNVFWVEAMPHKVSLMQSRGIKNIYQGVIDIQDNKNVQFNITNNGQSSSILEFGSHSTHHPQVNVVSTVNAMTTRLDSLIERNNIPITTINFINLDIQGVELRALKSMEKYLKHITYIYTEVNTEHVYKNCDLMQDIDVYLEEFGFKRVATKMFGNCGWGDAFYVRL